MFPKRLLANSFLKSVFHLIAADVLKMINVSLLSGTLPKSLKTAAIKPLLKKNHLDASMMSSYWPISNLPFVGKIIEKIVFNQLTAFLISNGY